MNEQKKQLDDYSREKLVNVCVKLLKSNQKLESINNRLKIQNEGYKAEIATINKKAENRKKDLNQKLRTNVLYKRLLEKLVLGECEDGF